LQKVSGIGALGGQGSKFIRAYAEIVGDLCNLIRAAVYQFAASSIRLAVSVDPVGNCAENFFKAGIWWIANHLIQSSILLQYMVYAVFGALILIKPARLAARFSARARPKSAIIPIADKMLRRGD
jgi:hypothetical protein